MSMFVVSNAYAGYITMAFDLSYIGGSGTTALFNEMNLDIIHATSNYAAGFGSGVFSDNGNFRVSSLQLGGPVNDLGLSLATPTWELTGQWNNLTGSIVNQTNLYGNVYQVVFAYNAGSLGLYSHVYPAGGQLAQFGPDKGGYDGDTGATFTDGIKVATLSLKDGIGTLIVDMTDANPSNWVVLTGATTLNWDFVTALDGFWSDGTSSIADQLETQGFSTTFTNVKGVTFDVDFVGMDKIHSNNEGSAKVGVPEPTSMLLLGMGVAGLALFRRKRAA